MSSLPARDGGATRPQGRDLDARFGPADEVPRIAEALRGAADPSPAPAADPLDEFFWREGEDAPALAGFGAPAPVARAREPAEAPREWLSFTLAGEEYAVDIALVREILKAPVVTEVPRAPAHVLGVIMVRGEVVAVFDPRRRLALPRGAPGRSARVVVCDAGQGPRGILVDAVSEVVRLAPSAVEARPNGVGGASADYIVGLGREASRLLILLDLAALLSDGPGAAGDAP
jgi:purine-binding chemotaxis protein CheW